ncbi:MULTISPECIES: hypothetical protein [Streptomyces]|uniref:hypothetical protein n=1 Tax=Streptomyces TaxID=1883 RepID=UPI000A38C0B7|nr:MULTISPECIES: hypothetical protein [Streptomyces]MDX3637091.1 hypothetical protein [Streptomyces europaeiscabiei]MDX3655235.1 hypothetical protein [Streptomyces europaeiscabiei]WRZ53664.1 hypothetical protein OG622_45715 [Streptomyces sp. NBC_01314]
MGTSLTPEFWQLFAVLLVAAIGVTVVLTAALDELAVRLLSRRAHKPPTPTSYRPEHAGHRPSVHS